MYSLQFQSPKFWLLTLWLVLCLELQASCLKNPSLKAQSHENPSRLKENIVLLKKISLVYCCLLLDLSHLFRQLLILRQTWWCSDPVPYEVLCFLTSALLPAVPVLLQCLFRWGEEEAGWLHLKGPSPVVLRENLSVNPSILLFSI